MTVLITFELKDSFGRRTRKALESTATTLADAATYAAACRTLLAALTDLEIEGVTYSSRDASITASGEVSSNVDVGATFRVKLDDGSFGSHKIPGFSLALVGAGGVIAVDASAVAAYFNQFETAGNFRLNDGQYITNVEFGNLDK